MNGRAVVIVIIVFVAIVIVGLLAWLMLNSTPQAPISPPVVTPVTQQPPAPEQGGFGSQLSDQVQNPTEDLPSTNPFEAKTNPLDKAETNPFEYKNPFE